VGPEETAVARQRLNKNVSAAMDTQATIEEQVESIRIAERLEAMFSMGFVPKL
jgi:hypothetical protein